MDSNLNQTYKLANGRLLGYAEYGNPNGLPILYFHGHRSSRLEPMMYNFNFSGQNARLIAIDRPGSGLSTFQPNRTLLDWPDDVKEFAQGIKLGKFAIIGGSGGAPYACACAFKIPDLLVAVGLVSGLGPVELGLEGMAKNSRRELKLAAKLPFLLKLLFKMEGKFRKSLLTKDPEQVKQKMLARANETPLPDREIMKSSIQDPSFFTLMNEGFRNGIEGPFQDGLIYGRPWGFSLAEIPQSVKVFQWHGEQDTSVPIQMARGMAKLLPNCQSFYFPDEAHLSTAVRKFGEILQKLLSNF